MKTAADYLDEISKKFPTRNRKGEMGPASDYAISKLLGKPAGHITQLRHGSTFGDELAIKVAELLEIDPGEVMANMNAQRAKSAQARAVWERIAKEAHRSAAAMVAVILAGGLMMNSPAEAGTYAKSATDNIYIMRTAVGSSTPSNRFWHAPC